MMPSESHRLRAADDFDAIRARMEELRRDRAHVTVDDNSRRADRPQPYAASSRPSPANRVVFPPAIMRRLARR
jgi:hypothetical protein